MSNLSWTSVTTNAGKELLASLVNGGGTLRISKVTIGEGEIAAGDMKYATALVTEMDTGRITSSVPLENGLRLTFQFGPCATRSFEAKEIGLWAESGSSEILFQYYKHDTGVPVPSGNISTDFSMILSAFILIDDVDEITVNVQSEQFVSQETLDADLAALNASLANKVDKVTGKALSTNDFTTTLKNKLNGIAANANNYTLPTASASVLGGIKVGNGLSMANDGTLSATAKANLMTGASSTSDGASGYVPAPTKAQKDYFLRGDGNWAVPTDTTYTAGSGISISSSKVIKNSGVRGITTGQNVNGTINVNTNGTSVDVPVKGLGSAAFMDSTAFVRPTDTIDIEHGGTNMTSNPSMLVDLASTDAANVFQQSPRPGVTGTLPITRGGTGLETSPSMLVRLNSTSAANVLAASPRPGVTGTLPPGNGGTGVTSLDALKSAMSLPKSIGWYTGNGVGNRKITLGYEPSRVCIFAMGSGYYQNKNYQNTFWKSGSTYNNLVIDRSGNYVSGTWENVTSGTNDPTLLTSSGDTLFASNNSDVSNFVIAAIASDGFYVNGANTAKHLVNENGCQYMYLAW